MKNEKLMSTQLLLVGQSIWAKIGLILSSCWGWISALILSFIAYIAPIQIMLIVLLVIVIVDMLLGLWINRHNILSSKLRNTAIKAAFYMIVLVLAFSIETTLKLLILSPIIFSICALVELISVIANMSIIAPNIMVFSLIRKLLRTEIAKKTGLDQKDVDNALDEPIKEETK